MLSPPQWRIWTRKNTSGDKWDEKTDKRGGWNPKDQKHFPNPVSILFLATMGVKSVRNMKLFVNCDFSCEAVLIRTICLSK